MKFQGKELTEYTPAEAIFFNPPQKMLVWDSNSNEPTEVDVVAFIPSREDFPVVAVKHTWMHCAEIPERKSELATFRELSRWLAEGKGEMKVSEFSTCHSLAYMIGKENKPVFEHFRVRKWSETEWHKPTREHLGLEGE